MDRFENRRAEAPHPAMRIGVALAGLFVVACFLAANTLSNGAAEAAASHDVANHETPGSGER